MGTAILTAIWLLFPSAFRVHSYQGQIQSSSFSAAFLKDIAQKKQMHNIRTQVAYSFLKLRARRWKKQCRYKSQQDSGFHFQQTQIKYFTKMATQNKISHEMLVGKMKKTVICSPCTACHHLQQVIPMQHSLSVEKWQAREEKIIGKEK